MLLGWPSGIINQCGVKLPTIRQVPLFCFHAIDKSGNRKNALKKTVKGVITFCNMARIETIYEISCECKLKKLWEEWRGLKKGKDKAAAGEVDDFKKGLDQLCDVGRQTH